MSDKELQTFEDSNDRKLLVKKTSNETKEAIEKILAAKHQNDKVTTLSTASTNNSSTYVKYTSAQISNLTDADGKPIQKQRIIKITDEKVDPMLPSGFQIRKAPPGPRTDEIVPVLHDEQGSDKLTKSDQKKWNIAPAVSNWKNTKGFIIGIDNRIQNSSQSGSTMTTEDIEKSTKRFTALSDALKGAEAKAKQDLKVRASWRKQKEVEKSEETKERLSKLAEESRKDRQIESSSGLSKLERREERRRRAQEELQRDRTSTKDKIRKLAYEQGRDVSNRVVIGVTEALKNKQEDSVFDSNLYMKSSGPSDSHDGDKVYDTPLFSQEAVLSDIYRTRNIQGHTGLGSSAETNSTEAAPVSFVKESELMSEEAETPK